MDCFTLQGLQVTTARPVVSVASMRVPWMKVWMGHIFHFSRLISISRARVHEGIMVVCRLLTVAVKEVIGGRPVASQLLFRFGEQSQMLQNGDICYMAIDGALAYTYVCIHTLQPISLHSTVVTVLC